MSALEREEHDKRILAGLNIDLDNMDLADEEKAEDARDSIIATVTTLLYRLGVALSAASAKRQADPKWEIDRSTGSPILVYEKCSVIQDEQAFYLMSLIEAASPKGQAEAVAWRWRIKGAETWVYDPTPDWVAAHGVRNDIDIEPLYASPAPGGGWQEKHPKTWGEWERTKQEDERK